VKLTWKRAAWSGIYWAKTEQFKYAVDKPGSRWVLRIWTQATADTLSKIVDGDDDFATMRDAKAYAQQHADKQEA
jgi:hypothetical protein